jgi:hypothetical protein
LSCDTKYIHRYTPWLDIYIAEPKGHSYRKEKFLSPGNILSISKAIRYFCLMRQTANLAGLLRLRSDDSWKYHSDTSNLVELIALSKGQIVSQAMRVHEFEEGEIDGMLKSLGIYNFYHII